MPDNETVQQFLQAPAQTLYLLLAMIVSIVVGILLWWGGKSLLNFTKAYLEQLNTQAKANQTQLDIQKNLLEQLNRSVLAVQELATASKRTNDDNKAFHDSNSVKLKEIQKILKEHEDSTPVRITEGVDKGILATKLAITDATEPLKTMLKNYGIVFDNMLSSLAKIETQSALSNDNINGLKAMITEANKSIKAIVDYAPPIKTDVPPLPHDDIDKDTK